MHSLSLTRRLLALAATSALVGLRCTPAFAQDAPPQTDLQAQVRQLTTLVQSLAEKDQAQIQALQAQVKALQAQLDAQTAQTAQAKSGQTATGQTATGQTATGQTATGQTATPRVAQNAATPYTVPGAQPPADAGIATPRVAQNETRHFTLQSDDGRFSIGFAGVIQFDAGDYFGFHPESKVVGPQELSDGINARRARIGVSGTAAGGWSYAFLYDGGNSQDTTAKGIETAQVVYGGFKGVAFEIGYSNTNFTLDQATSGNDLVFLERASPSDIATAFNAGDFRSNAGVRFFGDRYWIGGYLTGPASGDSHTTTGERFGAFERAAFQVASGKDYSLHLGVGVDELLRAPNAGNGTPNTLSLSDQPELRVDPTTFLNSGTIGTIKNPVTGGHVIDVETAATWKGWLWQGEYYHYDVDRQGLSSNSFDGYYGQIAYTLTGETHTYNTQSAAYYRIFPTHEFSLRDGSWGAWELAARISYVDLNSNFISGASLTSQPAAIDGGKQTGYTVGLSWYPNDIVRFMLDYNRIDYDKVNGSAVTGAALGVPVGARFNAVSLRSQVVF